MGFRQMPHAFKHGFRIDKGDFLLFDLWFHTWILHENTTYVKQGYLNTNGHLWVAFSLLDSSSL